MSTELLTRTHPEVLALWHPTKNGGPPPEIFPADRDLLFWWQCPEGHEWEAPVSKTASRAGCGTCASIGHRYPALAALWHPTKNCGLDVDVVTPGSGLIVWWVCSRGHEWDQCVNRVVATGGRCPQCHSVGFRRPDLREQWDYDLNEGLHPDRVGFASQEHVWWKCEHHPSWQARVEDRVRRESGCPECAGTAGRRVVGDQNCVAVARPVWAAQWHPTKNGDRTPKNTSYGQNVRVWFRCEVDPAHEWSAVLAERSKYDAGCPCCKGRAATVETCLATVRPDVAGRWDYEVNGDQTPFDVTAGSNKVRGFRCPDGHQWTRKVQTECRRAAPCPLC